jgi:hypothetical protein
MMSQASQALSETYDKARKSVGTAARKAGAARVKWANGHSWVFPDGSKLIVEKNTGRVREE